ncbi:MAG: S9 family peptidase, partial [Gammaproteobacteria bacterium]|nr:S9 family peptidase [Gammaproteobacteria bacterium]
MKNGILFLFSLLLVACGGSSVAPLIVTDANMGTTTSTMANDPYLWLEGVEDEKALNWVRAQNARSLAVLEAEPAFDSLYAEALEILTSKARIPHGTILGNYVYNHWQDEDHVRGLWRRATLSSYVANTPQWEVLLDIDKLDQQEKQNWIFEGYQCLGPDYDRCLLSLSRGGKDADVKREFSIADKAF